MEKFYRLFVIILLAFQVSDCALYAQKDLIIEASRVSPVGLVSYASGVKLSGIGNSKHIDGYVKTYGDEHFIFPVGHHNVYRPFAAESAGTYGAYYKENPSLISLQGIGPFNINAKDSTVNKISSTEFWDINGTNTSKLSLTWNHASSVKNLTGDSLSRLSIVGWNSLTNRWESIRSSIDEMAITGWVSNIDSGSITTLHRIIPNSYEIYSLASLSSSSIPQSFDGLLESINCDTIKGWAWDKSNPLAHVTVELLDADVVIATGAAVTYRADLEGAGLGTGRYGFSIVVPPLLKDGEDHNIKLRVRNSTYTLQNSLQNLNCPYGGRLEEVDCANFKGWAWNPNKPNLEGLTVELLENNIVLGSTNAKIYREDLAANGIGTGYYGFLLPIPQSLKNGYAHTVSMRIKGTNFFLDESPKTFTCFSPSYEG
ncbi:T9SS C-terminal target domain-containing protein, partial [Dyadobacter sp. CY357]|nr:T9SS C-terminal target domain-containing protein [Dyadobacter chenhuakuii]